jgi:hypothetical protein
VAVTGKRRTEIIDGALEATPSMERPHRATGNGNAHFHLSFSWSARFHLESVVGIPSCRSIQTPGTLRCDQ